MGFERLKNSAKGQMGVGVGKHPVCVDRISFEE